MKIIKIVIVVIVSLGILGVAGFFYLGQKSAEGASVGLVNGKLSPCPDSPNCVSSEIDTPEDKKVPVLPSGVWKDLPSIISALGGEVTKQSDVYLSAEFTSDFFGFVDDVEFRRAVDSIHVRSASRVGYSDRGVNLARVTALREELNK